MAFTWGFLVLFTVFIIPGLIIRRLYYYGEFSKQFGFSEPLVKLISYALIPGVIHSILTFYFFDSVFIDINLGKLIDTYKNLAAPDFKYGDSNNESIKSLMISGAFPFLGFNYLSAIIIGFFSGRIIRITRLDTTWKIFRYENQWFYLFNGAHSRLRKYKFLKKKKEKFLFTRADILVDSNEGTKLYSGILVDYELREKNCQELSKVVLKDASRYSKNKVTGKLEPKPIYGDILVVDCMHMLNINLTYIYGASNNFIQSNYRKWIYRFFTILFIFILPFLMFQTQWIEWDWYNEYFQKSIISRIFYYLFIIQAIQVFNPIIENPIKKGEFQWKKRKHYFANIVFAILVYGIAKGCDYFMLLIN